MKNVLRWVVIPLVMMMTLLGAPVSVSTEAVTEPPTNLTEVTGGVGERVQMVDQYGNTLDFVLTVVSDGTGHGTNDACFMNEQNGYPNGDNTSNDGVVCLNDTVTYRMDWNASVGENPMNVSFESRNSTEAEWQNQYVNPSGDGLPYEFAFDYDEATWEEWYWLQFKPDNPSISGSFTFTADASKPDEVIDYQIRATYPRAGGAEQNLSEPTSWTSASTRASSVTVIQQTQLDSWLTTGTTELVEIDRKLYRKLPVTIESRIIKHPDYWNTKGSFDTLNYTAALHLHDAPEGTLVSRTEYGTEGDRTAASIADGTATYSLDSSVYGWGDDEQVVNFYVPHVNTATDVLSSKNVELSISDVTAGWERVPLPDLKEFGTGEPIDFAVNDFAPEGVVLPTPESPNNNWATFEWWGEPTGDLFQKTNVRNRSTTNSVIRVGEYDGGFESSDKLLTALTLNGDAIPDGTTEIAMVDTWERNTLHFEDFRWKNGRNPEDYGASVTLWYSTADQRLLDENGYGVTNQFSNYKTSGDWSTTKPTNTRDITGVIVQVENVDELFFTYDAELLFGSGKVEHYPNQWNWINNRGEVYVDETYRATDWENSLWASSYAYPPSTQAHPKFGDAEAGNYNDLSGEFWFNYQDHGDTGIGLKMQVQLDKCFTDVGEPVFTIGEGTRSDIPVNFVEQPESAGCGLANSYYEVTLDRETLESIPEWNTAATETAPSKLLFYGSIDFPSYARGFDATPDSTLEVKSRIELVEPEVKNYVSYFNEPFAEDYKSLKVTGSEVVGHDLRVDTPEVKADQPFDFTYTFYNFTSTDFGQWESINVLPYNGDARGTKYTGDLKLTGVEFVPAITPNKTTLYYTTREPSLVNSDPHDVSNTNGETQWCSADQFGTEGCPADMGDATAVKLVVDELAARDVQTFRFTMLPEGNSDGDIYIDQVGFGRVEGLQLEVPVSKPVQVTVVDPHNPNIDLTKEADRYWVSTVGETVNYTFTVKNNGDVELSQVTLTDPLEGLTGLACEKTTLAPDESMTCSASLTVTEAHIQAGSIDNAATVRGVSPKDVPVEDEDSTTTPVAPTPEVDSIPIRIKAGI